MPLHSATFRHRLWPCEVDVHHYFPGFLAPADVVFEALWDRRDLTLIAGCDVACVDRVAHAGLAALHYLRGGRTCDVRRLCEVIRRDWTATDLADLADLAVAIGSDVTLSPLLVAVEAPVRRGTAMSPADYEAWRLRVDVSGVLALPWLLELRRLSWSRRPVFLWVALASDEHALRRGSPDLPPGRRALVGARVRRIRRGLRALPAAVRALPRLDAARR